jgi:hypothetical protein
MSAKDHAVHSRGRLPGRAALWAFGCVTYVAIASGATLPPVLDESISEPEAAWRAGAKPAPEVSLGDLHIVFERTTLQDVLAAISGGVIDHHGDAAESVAWICYTLGGARPARVWIESSGEMGGPNEAVTAIAVQETPSRAEAANCPLLSDPFTPIVFGHGVRLGLPEARVSTLFSSRWVRAGARAFIGYHGKVQGNCEGGFDLLNSLDLVFHHGRLVFIEAGQVTTC